MEYLEASPLVFSSSLPAQCDQVDTRGEQPQRLLIHAFIPTTRLLVTIAAILLIIFITTENS
jgi:hypothetical protein